MKVLIAVSLIALIAVVQSTTQYNEKAVNNCAQKYSLTSNDVCEIKNGKCSGSPNKNNDKFIWCVINEYGWLEKKKQKYYFSTKKFNTEMKGFSTIKKCTPSSNAIFTPTSANNMHKCYMDEKRESIILSKYKCESKIDRNAIVKDCMQQYSIPEKQVCDLKNAKYQEKNRIDLQDFTFCVMKYFGWIDEHFLLVIDNLNKMMTGVTDEYSLGVVAEMCAPYEKLITPPQSFEIYNCYMGMGLGSITLSSYNCPIEIPVDKNKVVNDCKKQFPILEDDICALRNGEFRKKPIKISENFVTCVMEGYKWIKKSNKNQYVFDDDYFDEMMNDFTNEEDFAEADKKCKRPTTSVTSSDAYNLHKCYMDMGLTSIILTDYDCPLTPLYKNNIVNDCKESFRLSDSNVCNLKNAIFSREPNTMITNFVFCVMQGYGWINLIDDVYTFNDNVYEEMMSEVMDDNNFSAVDEICGRPISPVGAMVTFNLQNCYIDMGFESIILSDYECPAVVPIDKLKVVKDCKNLYSLTDDEVCDLKSTGSTETSAKYIEDFVSCIMKGYGWIDDDRDVLMFNNENFEAMLNMSLGEIDFTKGDAVCRRPVNPVTSTGAYDFQKCYIDHGLKSIIVEDWNC